jgi:tetratricopeptide (TPR) repeat protein
MKKMARAARRAIAVITAMAACLVVSSVRLGAQQAANTTVSAQAKERFVSSLTQLLEAVAGTYGDEGDRVGPSLDSMQRALGAWDDSLSNMQSRVPVDGDIEAHFALGVAYLDRLRLNEALREFAAANAIDARHPEVHVFSGVVHSLQGSYAGAVAAFAAASRLDPENPAILYRFAHSLGRAGRVGEAAEAFRRFSDVYRRRLAEAGNLTSGASFARVDLLRQIPGAAPIFPPGAYSAGMAALRDGKFAEAIDLLRKAAATDPLTATTAARAKIREGAGALRQGALSAAIDHFAHAIALDPKSSEAHRLAGMAYWADEQYDRSVDHLQKAIVLNASDDRARVALADAFAAAGRLTDTEQALRDAVKAVPSSGLARYRLGRLLYDSPEKWPDATDALEAAIRLHPVIGSDLIYQMLTHMHLVALNADAAVEAGKRRIEAHPNQAEAYRVLGEAYVQQGRDAEAVPQFLAALLVRPQDASSWTALAQSQLRTGEYAEAVSSARRAIQIDSANAGAQFVLASALVRLGRSEEGATELERFQRMQLEAQAREAREWELKMLHQEASARLQQGEQEQAITALRAAVALAPEVASGYLSLGAVLKSAGRHAEAIEQFRKALDLRADAAACRLLVESYEALGQANEATRYRSECVRLKEQRVKSGSWRR